MTLKSHHRPGDVCLIIILEVHYSDFKLTDGKYNSMCVCALYKMWNIYREATTAPFYGETISTQSPEATRCYRWTLCCLLVTMNLRPAADWQSAHSRAKRQYNLCPKAFTTYMDLYYSWCSKFTTQFSFIAFFQNYCCQLLSQCFSRFLLVFGEMNVKSSHELLTCDFLIKWNQN